MSSSLPLLQANLRPDILYYCTFNPPTIPKIQGPENTGTRKSLARNTCSLIQKNCWKPLLWPGLRLQSWWSWARTRCPRCRSRRRAQVSRPRSLWGWQWGWICPPRAASAPPPGTARSASWNSSKNVKQQQRMAISWLLSVTNEAEWISEI